MLIVIILTLALMAVSPVQGEALDSLTVCLQKGDSCMQQYNTFEALRYYQQAYDLAQSQDITRFSMDKDFSMSKPYVPEDKVPRHVRLKLADCHYQRADYRQTAELLKNMPEDSLSHDAFRELALSYQKQGDTDSYIYWASQLLGRFPMDAEIVAGLILAFAKNDQPQNGIICGLKYTLKDSTNILVNRALADAWFMNRDFTAAAMLYDKLLEQGDSTFNTLYSAGMSHSQTGSLERAYDCLSRALEVSQMQHAGCAPSTILRLSKLGSVILTTIHRLLPPVIILPMPTLTSSRMKSRQKHIISAFSNWPVKSRHQLPNLQK